MRVLVTGLPIEHVQYLENRLPTVEFSAAPMANTRDKLHKARFDLLVLGSNKVGSQSLDILKQVRDAFHADVLPLLYVVPDEADHEYALRRAVELQAHQILIPPVEPEDMAQQAAYLLNITLPPVGRMNKQEWDRQRGQITPQIDILERAAGAVDHGTGSPVLVRSGVFEARKLKEFLSSVGHAYAADLCEALISIFEGEPAPPGGVMVLVDRLRSVAAEAPGAEGPPLDDLLLPEVELEIIEELPPLAEVSNTAPVASGPRLVLVDADTECITEIRQEAVARGMQVEVAPDLDVARAILARGGPDAIVFDLALASSWEDLTGFMEIARHMAEHVPLIIFTTDNKQDARLAGVRLGADLFAKPMPAPALLSLVEHQMGSAAPMRSRVLVVEDDAVTLNVIQIILDGGDYECIAIADSLGFWEALEETQPDLVMLDVELPEVSGIELCRMMRNDPRWSCVPIMFLTAMKDEQVMEDVYKAGADDFAYKPISAEDLLQRVSNRLARSRALRQTADLDPLTGLLGRLRSSDRFAQFFKVASIDSPVSLAVVNVDLFSDINVCAGQDTGDALLRRLARILESLLPNAIVSRWGGDEFVIGFYGLDRDAGSVKLGTVLDAVRQEVFGQINGQPIHITFSAGVAEYGRDGTGVLDLYRSARMAMAEVKRSGRNAVRSCSWFEDPGFAEQPTDVVILHEDEAFASQVLIALGVRGYHGQLLAGGKSVLSKLLAAAASKPGLAVVLDLDMAGADGWSLLRVFQSDEVLSTAKVVALSADPSDARKQEAYQLGAFVVLPSNTQFAVLMHHVRQALNG